MIKYVIIGLLVVSCFTLSEKDDSKKEQPSFDYKEEKELELEEESQDESDSEEDDEDVEYMYASSPELVIEVEVLDDTLGSTDG